MQTDSGAAGRIAVNARRCALKIADTRARGIVMANADWLRGEAYLRVDDIKNAALSISRAKKLALQLKPSGRLYGDILLSSGGIHQSRGEPALALADYQGAHRVYSSIGDTRQQAVTRVTMGLLYYDAKDLNSALKYLDQAQDIYSSDAALSVSIFNNRGLIMQDLGRFRDSEIQYAKALALADRMGSALLRARILGNIARVRLKAGDVGGADAVIRRGYALTGDGEAAVWRSQFVGLAAQAALQHHAYAHAATLIGERFEGVDPDTTTLTFREAHQTAYEAYRAIGDTEHALVHLAALKRLDDKATALATSSNTALMAARFDFANQALKIAKLQAEDLRRSVAFQRARAQSQRTIFLGAAGSSVVVIGLLVLALVIGRRARRKVDAANADLAVTNASLARALAAKTEFLATTSHEIRTPLNGILGMTQVMLADPRLSPDLRDRIGIVHGAGTTMRTLVDDILDVAKMETGKLTLEHIAFDLAETIAGATRMWEDQARAKGVGFTVDLADCPGRIMGDPARVRQIMFNLLSNALKFTPSGAVRLRVAAVSPQDYAIAISDSGIGIAAAQQEVIFESFRQADAGTTRRFGGTGLGLAICRNLARAMGGDIAVASREGEGATFTVTLPLVHAEPIVPPCAAASQGDGPVLLVVDRSPIGRSMFRTLLAPHVGSVRCAASMDEAVGCIAAGGIAQVLLDEATVRDAGDPVETVSAIAAAARPHGTGVALLWQGADEEGCRHLAQTGIAHVIAKPIGGGALAAAIFGPKTTSNVTESLVSHAA